MPTYGTPTPHLPAIGDLVVTNNLGMSRPAQEVYEVVAIVEDQVLVRECYLVPPDRLTVVLERVQ